ncbi:tetratricopeptide repeat protein [Streptomyces sp. AC627_RSS907]|uniref:tetratricopeptide repeat protein n=1 Tax=Streptomyces sp. AC627_RSS907 TaxID=2823684 RepID=UPI001C24C862|nr:tetratricopeptide repeat protein [Streptomyces sp. AC627_RSS907]
MSRLGRDKQRGHERAERSPAPVATPIDVRVPDAGSGARSASVDGSLVVAAPGEEIQNAVLNRLHRLALAVGHPVRATIHDERLGYAVPLRVDPDGSSHLAAEPVPTAPEGEDAVRRDRPARVLGQPVRSSAPTSRPTPAPEPRRAPGGGSAGSAPASTLRALPEPAAGAAPGTVAPPTGVFGPPPRMDGAPTTVPTGPAPAPTSAPATGTGLVTGPGPVTGLGPTTGGRPTTGLGPTTGLEPTTGLGPVTVPGTATSPGPVTAPEPIRASKPAPLPEPADGREPDPKPAPAPVRGFDAVAEAVLGDAPLTAPGDTAAPALLAGPTARVNEAVREGRTEEAARWAEQTVLEASRTLGPEHPEVLRLRELTAYIAYLSGDPDRAFGLALDLARIHRQAGDAEAAYGNVQSAATAWRAVRDPARGLELGHDLVGLWGELAAEEGPAAQDTGQLESARTRMGRLTERVRAQAG